jgi:5-deoxy-glucuronate isomerase
MRTYSSAAGDIDIMAEVHTGDVALVPFGWHGPCVAAPGYDLYYLNVMAGPDPDRSWRISDDPAHGWIRDTWVGQEFDSRLPYTS